MYKIAEHTDGTHIYMYMALDNGRKEEIDVYLTDSGKRYVTSADCGAELDRTEKEKEARAALRSEIIRTFETLY